jgi:hypothetical protein
MMQRIRGVYLACLALFTLVFVACGAPQAATTSVPATRAVAPLVTATPAPVLVDIHADDSRVDLVRSPRSGRRQSA